MENRRQHARYDAEVAAEVDFEGDTLIGETRDISAGGVSVILDRPIEEGTRIELTLILTQDGIEDPDSDPFETGARVMWAAPTDDGTTMMGLRFEDLGSDQAALLGRFLEAIA